MGRLVEAFSTEGVGGMYRGLLPSLVTLSVSNFIFFFTYHRVRASIARARKVLVRGGYPKAEGATLTLLLSLPPTWQPQP